MIAFINTCKQTTSNKTNLMDVYPWQNSCELPTGSQNNVNHRRETSNLKSTNNHLHRITKQHTIVSQGLQIYNISLFAQSSNINHAETTYHTCNQDTNET